MYFIRDTTEVHRKLDTGIFLFDIVLTSKQEFEFCYRYGAHLHKSN